MKNDISAKRRLLKHEIAGCCVAWAVAPSVALALPPLGFILLPLPIICIEASFIDFSTSDMHILLLIHPSVGLSLTTC